MLMALVCSSGLGPGSWQFAPTDAGASIPVAQQAFYNQHGFYITLVVRWPAALPTSLPFQRSRIRRAPGSLRGTRPRLSPPLRPESDQSAFYAWRATGDTKYQDFAAAGIRAIRGFLNSTVGFAPLNDVTQGTWSLTNQGNDLEVRFPGLCRKWSAEGRNSRSSLRR